GGGGVLPLALDQPARLEVPEQRIDRVGIHRDHAVRDVLDLLDQPIAVGGLALDQMQDKQREYGAAPDLPAEDVHRAAASPPRLARLRTTARPGGSCRLGQSARTARRAPLPPCSAAHDTLLDH